MRRSRNNALLDWQIDECLDGSCAGGGGSSVAIAELVGNAGRIEISGEVARWSGSASSVVGGCVGWVRIR